VSGRLFTRVQSIEMRLAFRFGVLLTLSVLAAHPALANPESDVFRTRAADELYNLDRDRAIESYRKAVAADPEDAAAYRGLAGALWLSITFRRGNMTVDDYLGRVSTRTKTPAPPPPPDTAAAFRDALDRAIAVAQKRLSADPKNVDAHFQLGAVAGLRASYIATIDGHAAGAFRAARDAYEEHERVLTLDANRKDAGLIVGTYRYIVSTLSFPVRWAAYVVGFGGDKERGIHLIEDAAAYAGDNQTDARLALVLIYNRERRYDEALKQLETLRSRYPRNRLFWLETGSTNLRAGRPAEALRAIDDGMTRFASDTRPRMFGEEALWRFKRGSAYAALNQASNADQELRKAAASEGRPWVLGRSHLELGKLALKSGRTADARRELQTAAMLCDSDNDGAAAEEARRLMP
jgi:tetratricopeptide (TPR) repeat protein